MSIIYAKRLKGWRFVLFSTSLVLSHALVLFNAGAYIAMLPRVAGGLGIPLSYATWTQTNYMIALALAFPVGGWLSRRIGEYRPFIVAFAVFALASWICAYSTSFSIYLAGRLMMGFAGGLTLPLGQSLLFKECPDKLKSVSIGVWSLFTLTPFTFAPPFGGWIADTMGWRWLFWINIPVALTTAGIVGSLLYRRGYKRIWRRFDFTGFLLIAVILGCLQTILNLGNDWDWTNSLLINVLIIVMTISLVYWIVWELGSRYPFLDIGLFAHRNFTIGALSLFLGFLCFQGLLSMLILQLQVTLGYSSWLAGLVFLPMAIFAKPMGGIFHEIIKRFDARLLASFNLLGFAATYFWLSRFDASDAYAELFWPKLLEGMCLGSFFVPLTALMLHGLPPERQWRAVELAGLMRIAAGAIGITLQTIIIYQRKPLHMTSLAEALTPFAPNYDQALEPLLAAGLSEQQAFIKLSKIVERESILNAMNEAYWLAGCLFVGLSILVWFAYPTRQPANPTIARALRRKAQEALSEDA